MGLPKDFCVFTVMNLNILKKLTIVTAAAFLFSGCNLYKQMVIPTPYYPSTSQEQTVTSETTDSGVIEATSDVNQNEQVVTTVKDDTITVNNKTVVQRIPFPEAEYKSLAKTGSATVTGHIYLTTAGGSKVYGKQTRLYLNPVTSYSTQWYQKSYLGGAKMSKVDPRLFNYLKFTTSDSSGKFEFLNVPSGSYYLIGVVKCGSACGYAKPKSIRIAKKISVFGSDSVNVDLSKQVQ